MELIDLSQPITTGMPVYPNDPQVATESALNIDDDGATVTRLVLGTHTGTHLDAPAHAVKNGRTVDQLDLNMLDGEAQVLHVKTVDPGAFEAKQLEDTDLHELPMNLPGIVCIATGWDRYFYDDRREYHPYLSLVLARQLWQRGARVLGVDTLSPDPTSDMSGQFPVHQFWLGNDGVIVENLRGLTHLPQHVGMAMLPLPLSGLDGSPVRAVARINEKQPRIRFKDQM